MLAFIAVIFILSTTFFQSLGVGYRFLNYKFTSRNEKHFKTKLSGKQNSVCTILSPPTDLCRIAEHAKQSEMKTLRFEFLPLLVIDWIYIFCIKKTETGPLLFSNLIFSSITEVLSGVYFPP
uniref:Uncharacterized protein n=1 Tax=Micrurus surinamensis TaxID=129470 RepID=A0A2D4PTN3_MICSU